jgi:NAD(P)H-nitrite reductase large subunit
MTEQKKIICRCEEIDEDTIREAIRDGCHDLDSIKRRTRAGMGMCQSKTCSIMIARLIREETGKDMAQITPFTVRPPLRPIGATVICSQEDNEIK